MSDENNPAPSTVCVESEQDTQLDTRDDHDDAPDKTPSAVQQSSEVLPIVESEDMATGQDDEQNIEDKKPLAANSDNDTTVGQNEAKMPEVEQDDDEVDDEGLIHLMCIFFFCGFIYYNTLLRIFTAYLLKAVLIGAEISKKRNKKYLEKFVLIVIYIYIYICNNINPSLSPSSHGKLP